MKTTSEITTALNIVSPPIKCIIKTVTTAILSKWNVTTNQNSGKNLFQHLKLKRM